MKFLKILTFRELAIFFIKIEFRFSCMHCYGLIFFSLEDQYNLWPEIQYKKLRFRE